MKTQSKELTNFYREYLAWVESGAPETPVGEIAEIPFCRDAGLCYCLDSFMDSCKPFAMAVLKEMHEQFLSANLDKSYPFNNGSPDEYVEECYFDNCHKNEQRIQWVKDHLTEEFV